MSPTTIDVVLPVLDEALALPGVLAAMPEGFRAIVADNGSTDGSAALARELGATARSIRATCRASPGRSWPARPT